MTNFDQKRSKKSEKISKNDQKINTKMSQKMSLLNGKSEKLIKNHHK